MWRGRGGGGGGGGGSDGRDSNSRTKVCQCKSRNRLNPSLPPCQVSVSSHSAATLGYALENFVDSFGSALVSGVTAADAPLMSY